jgi:hypothetical protein
MGGQHNLLKLSPVWYQREFYSSAEETWQYDTASNATELLYWRNSQVKIWHVYQRFEDIDYRREEVKKIVQHVLCFLTCMKMLNKKIGLLNGTKLKFEKGKFLNNFILTKRQR